MIPNSESVTHRRNALSLGQIDFDLKIKDDVENKKITGLMCKKGSAQVSGEPKLTNLPNVY